MLITLKASVTIIAAVNKDDNGITYYDQSIAPLPPYPTPTRAAV